MPTATVLDETQLSISFRQQELDNDCDGSVSHTDGIEMPSSTSITRQRSRKNTGSRSLLEEFAAKQKQRSDSQAIENAAAAEPQRDTVINHWPKRNYSYPRLRTSLMGAVAFAEPITIQGRQASNRDEGFGFSSLNSSPIPFPSLPSVDVGAGINRPNSPHAKSYGGGKAIEIGRRRSRRATSNSSSWSPASAFLSQYNRTCETTTIAPDEEGQEIGDTTKYIIGRQIGYGGFSVIKEVFTIEDGLKARKAVKIMRKQLDSKTAQENDILQARFAHEKSIWKLLEHPYILPLTDEYDDTCAIYCIMPYNAGGSLHDLVRSLRRRRHSISSSSKSASTRRSSVASSIRSGSTTPDRSPGSPLSDRLPLAVAKRYIYQLASALRYLHQDMQIVHCDVKLENCLVNVATSDSIETGGDILLCDFGMAEYIDADASPYSLGLSSPVRNTAAGSLQYASPELLQEKPESKSPCVDIWAFGVVCYALLTLRLPFDHEFQPKLRSMILKGDCDFDALRDAVYETARTEGDAFMDPDVETDNVLELVGNCLEMDARERWDITKVLECEWLRGCAETHEKERW